MKTNLVLIAMFVSFIGNAQEPTRWRGSQGNGFYAETGLLGSWPANGPEIIWTSDGMGQGFTSPVFANGKIYVTGMIDQDGYLFILSEQGKIERKIKYGSEFYESYPGTRSTPTVVGDLLYVLTGHGRLVCIDLKAGNGKWEKNLFTGFDGSNIKWGVTESVVVDGDIVYVTPGGKKHNVVALNRYTGETVWSCAGKGELSAYCTPLLFTHEDKKILATHTASHILGIDAQTGELLWSHHHPNKWSVHANTPLYKNGMLLCTSGYGYGSVMLKLTNGGKNVEKVWFNKQLDNRMGGMVEVDGYIYASGDMDRGWKCVNWNTGETRHESTLLANGRVITAENKLIIYTERGELALVEANAENFSIKSKAMVTQGENQQWSHPVIYNGILFVRRGPALIAYKIK